jgi:preprotein translocase subunit YajC
LIKQIVGDQMNLPITGIVKSIQDDSCTVVIADEFTVSDVKIKATIGNDQFLMLVPKIGSTVLMLSLTGELDNLTIIKIDNVERFEYLQSGLHIVADSEDQKVQVKNEQCGLKEIMQDMADLLKGLKVYTVGGASGIPIETSQVAIAAFETKFKHLLK